MKTIDVGDWVRFYQNGTLVIGVVQYIGKDRLGYQELATDQGTVCVESVREVRKAQPDEVTR